MDDLEATFASFFRASSSSSGFSIVSKPAITRKCLNYFALSYSCRGCTKSVRKETMNRLRFKNRKRVYVAMINGSFYVSFIVDPQLPVLRFLPVQSLFCVQHGKIPFRTVLSRVFLR